MYLLEDVFKHVILTLTIGLQWGLLVLVLQVMSIVLMILEYS